MHNLYNWTKIKYFSRNQIHVFSFPNRCQKLYTLTTKDNPRGLCEISPMRLSHAGGSIDGGEFMVFPGYKMGSLQIVNMSTTEQHVSSAPVTINAHQNELCCIAINQQVGYWQISDALEYSLMISMTDLILHHLPSRGPWLPVQVLKVHWLEYGIPSEELC